MPKKYQSFADQFYLEDGNLLRRLQRDFRLLVWIARTIRMWFKAKPIRAEFEQCRLANQAFYVDHFAGPPSALPADPVNAAVDGKQAAARQNQGGR